MECPPIEELDGLMSLLALLVEDLVEHKPVLHSMLKVLQTKAAAVNGIVIDAKDMV